MKYGELPVNLGTYLVDCPELMYYLYLPIKLSGATELKYEERLHFINSLMGTICCDFVGNYGLNKYVESYVYLTVKKMWQTPKSLLNRDGYHSDGFLSEDINYIWSNKSPTIFNSTAFKLTLDDKQSMLEMKSQARTENEVTYPENSLLRLNQFNIHKVNEGDYVGWRTFVKVSFSLDKYNLIGNSKNYLLDYNWDMVERNIERNIPSVKKGN
jgi:hypothetical protein